VRASREAKVHAGELAAAQGRVAELEERLAHFGSRDFVVPGLLSLSGFRAQLEVDVQRAHRYGRALSVALVDVDGFRAYNLEHGYAAGDAVLGAVGDAIARTVRNSDLACRTGGDEFAVLLSETGAAQASRAIERVIGHLAEVDADGMRGLSAAAGVAELAAHETPEALLARAREGLESARASSGGRVMVAPLEPVARPTVADDRNGDPGVNPAERDRHVGRNPARSHAS